MTPAEELELIEVEQEIRRRRGGGPAKRGAELAGGEAEEGADDGEGDTADSFWSRADRSVQRSIRAQADPQRNADEAEILTRGVTLGFDDVAAGLGAKAGVLADGGTPAEADAAYNEAVAERRKVVEDAKGRMAKRGQYGAGALELTGALATAPLSAPLAVGRLAAVKASPYVARTIPRAVQAVKNTARTLGPAAVVGGTAKVGFDDANTLEEAGVDFAQGAALSGAITAAVPVAGRVVGAVADKTKAAIGGLLEKGGSRADELRVLTTSGAQGGTVTAPKVLQEAARVPGGVPAMAQVLRDSGVSKGVTTTEGILKRSADAFEESGVDIGRIVDDATASGGFVDTVALVARLRALADEASSGLTGVSRVNVAETRKLQAIADEIERLAPVSATPTEIKALSVALGKEGEQGYRAAAAGRPVVGQQEAIRGARREVEGTIPRVLDDLGLDSTAYQKAKTLNQTSRIARDAAQTSVGRADKNNMFSLGDMTAAGTAGAATANPFAAAGALLARKTIGPFSASLRATSAETARDIAQRLLSSPSFAQRAGPAAERLKRALSGPPQVLAQVHDEMMATDPAYRDAVRDEEFRAAVLGGPEEVRRASRSVSQ